MPDYSAIEPFLEPFKKPFSDRPFINPDLAPGYGTCGSSKKALNSGTTV